MLEAHNKPHYSIPLLRILRKTIGQNIRHHRHKHHMLISELSKATGIPEIMLDYYEMGKYRIRLHELLRIACVFQVEVRDLL